MAATVSNRRALFDWPWLVREVEMTNLVLGAPENIAHGGPAGIAPSMVEYEVIKKPTVPCIITMQHDKDNDSTSADTCRLYFESTVGADPAGAKVKVRFHFRESASKGISAA